MCLGSTKSLWHQDSATWSSRGWVITSSNRISRSSISSNPIRMFHLPHFLFINLYLVLGLWSLIERLVFLRKFVFFFLFSLVVGFTYLFSLYAFYLSSSCSYVSISLSSRGTPLVTLFFISMSCCRPSFPRPCT